MLRPTIILSILVTLATSLRAELTIVSAEHRDADSFKRISEYLTGQPSEGRYEIFRSDADQRDGFYVSLLASDRSALSDVSTVLIRFVRPGTQEVESAEIPAGAVKKKRLLVGLTNSEWAEENVYPVAWKIELLDQNETVLESAESFLWAKPR